MSISSSSQLNLFQTSNQASGDGSDISAKEKKYGKNDLNHFQPCPRCNDSVPVRAEMDFKNRKVRWHCRKCEFSGHIDGALIREWDMADYCWPEPALPAVRIFESQ